VLIQKDEKTSRLLPQSHFISDASATFLKVAGFEEREVGRMNLVEGEDNIKAWLLQAGFQPGDLRSEKLITGRSNCPMAWACRNGQLSVCRWLFEVGAAEDIRKADNDGYTPMCAACQEGHLSVMKYLILNSALNHPVSDTEKEGDAGGGHIDHTIVEHDVELCHRPALFDWAQKLLSSHALFVGVVLPASVVLQDNRARHHRCYLLLLPTSMLEMLRTFLGVEKGRALRNVREFAEILR